MGECSEGRREIIGIYCLNHFAQLFINVVFSPLLFHNLHWSIHHWLSQNMNYIHLVTASESVTIEARVHCQGTLGMCLITVVDDREVLTGAVVVGVGEYDTVVTLCCHHRSRSHCSSHWSWLQHCTLVTTLSHLTSASSLSISWSSHALTSCSHRDWSIKPSQRQ